MNSRSQPPGGVELSVVIPTFNAAQHLAEQLDALCRQDTPASWELIVSDNGSTDQTLTIVGDYEGRLPLSRVVDASDKRGPAHARNAGAAVARGEYILFCDADDVADDLWLHEMGRALRTWPLVGGRLENQRLNPGLVHGRQPLQETELPEYAGRRYVASANLGCSARLFRELDGFDEGFTTAAFEDVDFAFRAEDLGSSAHFVSAAVIYYRHRDDPEAALNQARSYGRASRGFLQQHDLRAPTLADDARAYLRLASRLAWLKLLQSPHAAAVRWGLAYRVAQTLELSRTRNYWSFDQTESHDPRSFRTAQRDRLRFGITVALRRLGKDLDGASLMGRIDDPWHAIDAIRGGMPESDRHLLGAGLLADANVEIHCARNGLRFLLNPSLDVIVREVITSGGYSSEEIEAVVGYLERTRRPPSAKARVIVNAGANVGTTALPLAKRGYSVIAIEPARRAIELLEANVALNDLKHAVMVVQGAVTADVCEVEMVVGDNLSTSEIRTGNAVSELGTPGDDGLHTERVKGRPLREILSSLDTDPQDVSLVWSDTEGAEVGVILGGTELWQAGVPLWVEIRPSAIRDHGRITDFVDIVAAHFAGFRTAEDVRTHAARRPISELRDSIDAVGYGRWNFTNVLLEN